MTPPRERKKQGADEYMDVALEYLLSAVVAVLVAPLIALGWCITRLRRQP